MTAAIGDGDYLVRLTPSIGLVRNTLLSILLVTVTVFGVLLFLGLRNGSWPIAAAGGVLTLLLTAIGYVRYRLTFVGITTATIEERRYCGGRTSFPRSDVASIVLADVYSNSSPDSSPQLIVRNSAGRRILRMRGAFWSIEAMNSLVSSLDIEPYRPAAAMSTAEFFRRFPGTAYWFENRPALTGAAVIGVLVAAAAAALGIMWVLGLPMKNG